MKPAVALLTALLAIITLRAAEPPVATLLGQLPATAVLRTMPSDTPANQRLDGLAFIAGYQVIGDPVPIPAEKSAALRTALESPTAFTATTKDEIMRPGVAYRFGTGADAVDLLVCFSCDKVAFIRPGADTVGIVHHITQPTRDVLLDLAKELLPQDEAIQELPKVRGTRLVPPPYAPIPKDAPRPGQPAAS
jgi:hypothetical protein